MVKGNKKLELLTYEEILSRTGGGYDLYMFYEGKVEKRMKRPWGKDNHPSWGLFSKNGVWFWKDMAEESSGTAIEYIMRKFNLSFTDAIAKIKWDFGWGGKEVNSNPVVVTWERKEDIPSHITVDSQPFTKKHHEFWNKVEINEIDCNRLECWALKSPFSLNRKLFRLKKDEIGFFYYAPEENKVKIYLPERSKDSRFINNVSYFYLWNKRNIQKCNDLIIQKSYKDLIITSLLTPHVIATQAEAVQIFNEETVSIINKLGENIHVFYGSDPDGVKKCKEITNTNKWRYINTPRQYLPDINDVYGIVKMWNEQKMGTGLKKLEEFVKSKKFPL